MSALKPLRPKQALALDMLKRSIAGGKRRPMVQAPTGFGKTVLGAHIVSGAMRKGNRVAFIVPALSLIDQTFDRFVENGIEPGDMGVIQADHAWRRAHAPIQICSVATLARRGMPQIDVAVVDEAHIRDRALHGWLQSDKSRSVLAVGLSATPWSKGLGLVYDDLIVPTSIRELIDDGSLSPFRVFAPSHPDLNGVKIDAKSGDYQTSDLSARMSDKTLVADIVTTWLERGDNRPTLCFAVDRAHAQLLAEQFNTSGVSTAYVDSFTTREERQDILARLRSGEIRVICNIGTMTTGIDEDIRCIILARPTKSESLFTQIIGRGLRTAPGKDHCLILDHSDTHLRLGMVTDIQRTRLDTGKPGAGDAKRDSSDEERVKLPRACSCGCLVPAGVFECPACGEVPKRRSQIETAEGELVELGARADRAKKKPASAREKLAAMGDTALFQQIESIRVSRHRKEGWSANLFKDITGKWPPSRLADSPVPMISEPCNELLSFVRHKDMAYAKAAGSRFRRAA